MSTLKIETSTLDLLVMLLLLFLTRPREINSLFENVSESKKQGSNFMTSMETAKKCSTGVIFKHGKCYVDIDILSVAVNAQQKRRSNSKKGLVSCIEIKMKRNNSLKMYWLNLMNKRQIVKVPTKANYL